MSLFKTISRVQGYSSTMGLLKLEVFSSSAPVSVSHWGFRDIEFKRYYFPRSIHPSSSSIFPKSTFKGLLSNSNRHSIHSENLSADLLLNVSQSCSYSTQNLFRLNESNAGQLQPVLDIENILKNQSLFQESISKRKLNRKDVSSINSLYSEAVNAKKVKENAQQERDDNTTKCQALAHANEPKEAKTEEMRKLKEKGRILREKLREAEAEFNKVNDELVDYVLSLPNILDPQTPANDAVLLNETKVAEDVKPWEFPEYTAVESPVGPGLLAEFPIGKSAWLDVHLREKAQAHLLKGGFVETGNAEYVKRIILQGAGIDHRQFLKIREPNVKKGWDHATYLAGGASFPSYLVLFSQSIIDSPQCLPLRYFVIGRSYELQKERPGSYQNHMVQALVACRNEEEMEVEFEKLKGLMESFYSTKVGFDFQTQIVPAFRLKLYEKKKLAFVMNKSKNSPSKMVGTLSTVGDYVSKRLLCCYFNEKKETQFLHLISAQFFNITHFLRTSEPRKVSHTGESCAIAVTDLQKQPGINQDHEHPPSNL